jgi:pyruvate carboxylase
MPRDTPILPVIVAEFEKNGRELIRIALDRYAGRDIIDVRTWYAAGDTFKPGKSGITVAVKHLQSMAEGLAAALAKARELGLINDKNGTDDHG